MMGNSAGRFFMAALAACVFTSSAAWAGRILIDDAGQTVTVSSYYSCHRPVDITIDTADPRIYEAGSSQLQKLGDSVRAMLGYECPGLSSIQLTGLIRGLDDIVYQGQMLKSNDWRITPLALENQESGFKLHSGPLPDATSRPKRYHDELKQGRLEVTGMSLGMTVAQVTDLVIETFGLEPHYDAEKGVLTMTTGECPADLASAQSVPEIDSQLKCLQAWFSDNRIARLQRLNLFQLVDGRVEQVNSLLVDKYGNPTQISRNNDQGETQMIWRVRNADDQHSVIQEVDATIRSVGNRLVATNVALYSTESTMDHPEGFADLDLKL